MFKRKTSPIVVYNNPIFERTTLEFFDVIVHHMSLTKAELLSEHENDSFTSCEMII